MPSTDTHGKVPVAVRIAALRSRIAAERDNSRLLAQRVAPRLNKTLRILAVARRIPSLFLKFSPLVLPFASMVFKRNRTLGWAVRGLGLLRIGRSVAETVRTRIAERSAVSSN